MGKRQASVRSMDLKVLASADGVSSSVTRLGIFLMSNCSQFTCEALSDGSRETQEFLPDTGNVRNIEMSNRMDRRNGCTHWQTWKSTQRDLCVRQYPGPIKIGRNTKKTTAFIRLIAFGFTRRADLRSS